MPLAPRQAPDLHVAAWLNTEAPLSLAALRGKIVVIHAFQMRCPGCVHHSLPLAQRMARTFDPAEVAIIGLHSVFEDHASMSPQALAEFVKERQIGFPIAIDAHDGASDVPLTMRAYGLQGTPTLILIDHLGRIRMQRFGSVDDLSVGASIGVLLAERRI